MIDDYDRASESYEMEREDRAIASLHGYDYRDECENCGSVEEDSGHLPYNCEKGRC